MRKPRTILGMALEDGSALVAEVRGPCRRAKLVRAAEFSFPPDVSIAQPARLGEALRQWLRQEHFSARHAVIGLPVKWLLSRQETIPPADREATADMLRVKAEQHFSLDPEDLCVDCCDGVPNGGGEDVLLVAALRERVNQVVEMAHAAGLRLQAVTASSLALASVAAASCCLRLRQDHAELTIHSGGRFRLLRHIPWPGSDVARADAARAIAGELRCAAAQSLCGTGPAGQQEVTIWHAGPPESASLASGAASEAAWKVKLPEGLSALGFGKTSSDDEADGIAFATAAALGLAGIGEKRLPIDFLHSALAARGTGRLGKPAFWAAAVAAALVIAALVFASDWRAQQRALSGLRARMDEMKPELERIREINQKVSFARAWCDTRPRFLDCLRQLTLTFPEQGTVWATSIAVRGDRGGVLSGKATDERAVLEVMDKMNNGSGFADVKLLYVREAGAGGRELAFAVSFAFPELE